MIPHLHYVDTNLTSLKVARIEAEDFKPTRKTLADRLALPNTYNDIPEYVCKHVAFVDFNESVCVTFTGICTHTMMRMVWAGLGYSGMAQTRLSLS